MNFDIDDFKKFLDAIPVEGSDQYQALTYDLTNKATDKKFTFKDVSSGGAILLVEITKNDFDTLVAGNGLVPGRTYVISDWNTDISELITVATSVNTYSYNATIKFTGSSTIYSITLNSTENIESLIDYAGNSFYKHLENDTIFKYLVSNTNNNFIVNSTFGTAPAITGSVLINTNIGATTIEINQSIINNCSITVTEFHSQSDVLMNSTINSTEITELINVIIKNSILGFNFISLTKCKIENIETDQAGAELIATDRIADPYTSTFEYPLTIEEDTGGQTFDLSNYNSEFYGVYTFSSLVDPAGSTIIIDDTVSAMKEFIIKGTGDFTITFEDMSGNGVNFPNFSKPHYCRFRSIGSVGSLLFTYSA